MNYQRSNVQNVHRWLTHMPEVGGGSLSQCCQWLSLVTQTKLTKVHFETRELVSACRRPSVCRLSSVCNVRSPYLED